MITRISLLFNVELYLSNVNDAMSAVMPICHQQCLSTL